MFNLHRLTYVALQLLLLLHDVGVQAQKTRFKLKALYALSGSRVESRSLSSARVKLAPPYRREAKDVALGGSAEPQCRGAG